MKKAGIYPREMFVWDIHIECKVKRKVIKIIPGYKNGVLVEWYYNGEKVIVAYYNCEELPETKTIHEAEEQTEQSWIDDLI